MVIQTTYCCMLGFIERCQVIHASHGHGRFAASSQRAMPSLRLLRKIVHKRSRPRPLGTDYVVVSADPHSIKRTAQTSGVSQHGTASEGYRDPSDAGAAACGARR